MAVPLGIYTVLIERGLLLPVERVVAAFSSGLRASLLKAFRASFFKGIQGFLFQRGFRV